MDHKWILISGLQKSIRRGRFDLAEPIARVLWETERSYLCYRLGVIVLEDIGLGDAALARELMRTRLKKADVDAAGGLDFIVDVIRRACIADKDRSACDGAYAASFCPQPAGWSQDPDEIAAHARSGPWLQRVQALWLLLGGQRYKNNTLSFNLTYPPHDKKPGVVRDDGTRFLMAAEAMGCDAEFLEDALSCTSEPMAVAWPVMADLDRCEGRLAVVAESLDQRVIRHGGSGLWLPASAIDGHTGEGRTVQERVLRDPMVVGWLVERGLRDPEAQRVVLKHLQFRREGHQVDRRVHYPSAVAVMRAAEAIPLQAKWPGGPGWVESRLFWDRVAGPRIDEIRRQSMDSGFGLRR